MIIIFVIVVFITLLGLFFSNRVLSVNTLSREIVLNKAMENNEFSMDKFNGYYKEEIGIKSRYGYILKGTKLSKTDNKSKKIMVFSHGVSTNSISSIKYVEIFINSGWDIIIYDHCRHGDSGGKITSYGYYEKDDLDSVIKHVKDEYGKDSIIGIHGESMGAAIAIQYASKYDGANFYIFDCPFSDLKKQLLYRLRVEYKLLGFIIIPLTNLFVRLRAGFSFKDVSPISVVANIKKPALFIHSKDDDYILSYMSTELYNKKVDSKELFIAANGGHAQSFPKNKSEYTDVVNCFLSNYNFY